MSKIDIPAGEHGTVRVFAIDLEDSAAAQYLGVPTGPDADWPLQRALGAKQLNPDYVDVFDTRSLDGIGMTGFLIEGHGVAPEELEPDAERLDSLDGHVAVIASGAFGGEAQQLDPKDPLRLIGSYTEAAGTAPLPPLHSEAAKGGGTGGVADPRPIPENDRSATFTGKLIAAICAGLLLFFALIFLGS